MLDREWMLEWQAKREEADRKTRLEELKIVRTGVWGAVIGIIVSAIITVVAAMIQTGILFPHTRKVEFVPTPSVSHTSEVPNPSIK